MDTTEERDEGGPSRFEVGGITEPERGQSRTEHHRVQMGLVWFEAPDVQKAFTELATSSDEFTIWFDFGLRHRPSPARNIGCGLPTLPRRHFKASRFGLRSHGSPLGQIGERIFEIAS
ncbi:MAG: hypothetical protein ABSC41_03940 [Acidimicrobiales bacterium]